MSNRRIIQWIALSTIFITLACTLGTRQVSPAPKIDTAATEKAQTSLSETAQAQKQASTEAEKASTGSQAATATAVAASTQAAARKIATAAKETAATKATEIAQATENAVAAAASTDEAAKAIEQAQQTEAAQAEADSIAATATAAVKPIYDWVLQLNNDGVLNTTEGNYVRLDSFDQSWAQLGWYQWWGTGYEPTNFVIRTGATWETAYERADLNYSGCGFVFHEVDSNNHILVYLGMDGYAYMSHFAKGKYSQTGHVYYGKLAIPSDSGELVLAVNENWITFYVNGKQLIHKQDLALTGGKLALTILSGTNKDYGTRCQMNDIDLWELP
jgi:hypothetical protein